MPEYYLLITDHCPLCTQAIQMIHQQQLEEPVHLSLVDLNDNPDLQNEYANLVPVLIRDSDDQELKWPFEAEQLKRFLES